MTGLQWYDDIEPFPGREAALFVRAAVFEYDRSDAIFDKFRKNGI